MNDAAVPPGTAHAPPAARDCRNCGGVIAAGDEFCRHCGQETHIGLPTARQFMREAAGRYVALDGRLWRTIRALAHPGLLTREYLDGPPSPLRAPRTPVPRNVDRCVHRHPVGHARPR